MDMENLPEPATGLLDSGLKNPFLDRLVKKAGNPEFLAYRPVLA